MGHLSQTLLTCLLLLTTLLDLLSNRRGTNSPLQETCNYSQAVRRSDEPGPGYRFDLAARSVCIVGDAVCQMEARSQDRSRRAEGKPVLAHPALDDSPSCCMEQVGSGPRLRPPACTDWSAVGFTTLVSTVAISMPRRRGLAQPHRGNFTSHGIALLVHHSQAMANTDLKPMHTDLQHAQRREDFTSAR
jgi:hypothetical protein